MSETGASPKVDIPSLKFEPFGHIRERVSGPPACYAACYNSREMSHKLINDNSYTEYDEHNPK